MRAPELQNSRLSSNEGHTISFSMHYYFWELSAKCEPCKVYDIALETNNQML